MQKFKQQQFVLAQLQQEQLPLLLHQLQVCKRTSYNTSCNTHRNGGVPFRKNYAGIGYLYDEDIDGFISPRIFPSWLLDIDTGCWEAPEPYPNDGKEYYWDENNLSWEQI
jgi:hypothetical protein